LPHPHFTGKKQVNQDVAEMQRRARLLLANIKEDGHQIVVPTIVVGEWLTGIDRAKHGSFVEALKASFVLAPFDEPAAAKAAQLWQDAADVPKEEKPSRALLKADAMIIATAYSAGARLFYSHELKVRKLATLVGMEGRDLPTAGKNLFAEHIPPPPRAKKKPD
jgi:predicted nucleic acid-binding protein